MTRRVFCLLLFVFMLSSAYAQTVHYAVSIGLNDTKSSLFLMKPRSDHYQAGVRTGVMADIKFGSLSIQPGIFYSQKGGKTKNDSSEVSTGILTPAIGNTKLILNYLELPVNFLYHIPNHHGNFFFGGGPYFALGLHAGSRFKGKYAGETVDQAFNEEFGTGGYAKVKKGDFGANGMVGYQFKNGLMISGGYGGSLINISSIGGSIKNQGFNLSAAYFIK